MVKKIRVNKTVKFGLLLLLFNIGIPILYILPLNASNNTLANTNNNSEIIEQFKRAIEIKPSADLYNRFGGFLNSIKKYDDAIVQIKKALEYNPNDTYAHFQYGFALIKL
jgi:tetratricopeptide (TPR) repeat protein